MESFCSSVVKEAIDGHAAVLMTHTKTGTGNHVGKVTAVANSFKKIKDRNPEPLDLQGKSLSDAKKHMSRQGWNA
jgi:hypothetical protein